jgi:hypothetical protein
MIYIRIGIVIKEKHKNNRYYIASSRRMGYNENTRYERMDPK